MPHDPLFADDDFRIADRLVRRGERVSVSLELGRLYDQTVLNMPVEVIRGRETGPILFVAAAVHGDELNGVEIVRRLLTSKRLRHLRGTLLAIPVVNVYGFNARLRYLPDRRDLNRSFPGSADGSLTARVAHTFMEEVVSRCTHGIDLHTGSEHRANLPQIRACLDDDETARLARAFGAPVIINSNVRDGSLRQAAAHRGFPTLLYEGGEALRFGEGAIRLGVKGVLAVMTEIGMLPKPKKPVTAGEVFVAKSSHWLRAPGAGLLRSRRKLGDPVEAGEVVAEIHGVTSRDAIPIYARKTGIIIGERTLPAVHRGDAVFHVGSFEDPGSVADVIDDLEDSLDWNHRA